jgi:hypothetical protein
VKEDCKISYDKTASFETFGLQRENGSFNTKTENSITYKNEKLERIKSLKEKFENLKYR